MCGTVSELYYFIYFTENYYEKSFKKEDEKSTDISSTSTLEGDEEEKVKNGKGTKILALNKFFADFQYY